MSANLADPIFAQVNLQTGLGYEYQDAAGVIQGPFPAIAIFTWGLQGHLWPDFKLRRVGRVEFHNLKELEREILLVARVQLSNVLLARKEWFYVDSCGKMQGPFSAERMTDFIGTRYMTESVKFFGRPSDTNGLPSAPPNPESFRFFGELLNECLALYRRHMNEVYNHRKIAREAEASIRGNDLGGLEEDHFDSE